MFGMKKSCARDGKLIKSGVSASNYNFMAVN